jgi:hypothetical protein
VPKKYQRNRYKKQMTKISRPASVQTASSAIAKSSTSQKSAAQGKVILSPYADEHERHHQVTKELKMIGLLTGILLPLLVIIAVILQKIG